MAHLFADLPQATLAAVLALEATSSLDLQGADMLLELAHELERDGIELRVAVE